MSAGPDSRPWRKYVRISVRGLIVLVLAVVAGLGWIVRQAHVQRDAVAAIIKARGQASYDIDPNHETVGGKNLSAWRRLLGEFIGIDFVFHVVQASIDVRLANNDVARQQALARLGDLEQLEQVNLAGKSVTDGDLARLAGLKHLQGLMLQNSGISDDGLAHLESLTNLREIWITHAGVGDLGLGHLKGLTNLKHLTYYDTRLTDMGMAHLQELRGLETLPPWQCASDGRWPPALDGIVQSQEAIS